MPCPKKSFSKRNLLKSIFTIGLISSCFYLEAINTKSPALSNMLEFRWDKDDNYKKLKYYQTSSTKMDRATYYFFLRKTDRKTGILKLSLKFPEYFKAKLKEKKITLCEAKIGGYSSRSRCLNNIPSTIEINEKEKTIDIFPNDPIPADKKTYAVKLKMFNPRKAAMYQVNAFSQSPGELPISLYLGSYLFEIQ